MPRRGRQARSRKGTQSLAALVGKRLRTIRLQKGLSQTDLEKRAGLLRSHISRIESGLRTPTVETLERLSQALEVPVYSLFYPARVANSQQTSPDPFLTELREVLRDLNESDREAVLDLARKMTDSSKT